MVKIDLVTGFLGSGKTTFIRKYVEFLLSQNEKVCICENDYGAINIDTLLLSDLKSDKLNIEMVVGGDRECYHRRFMTKLITMSLLGYDRVIVEPSGIFDIDEFFDTLNEDELYDRYQTANIFTIVDARLDTNLSDQSKYMLASQIACAGKVILSHVQQSSESEINNTINTIEASLAQINCPRKLNIETDILSEDWDKLTSDQLSQLSKSGYQNYPFTKSFDIDNNDFDSLFFMNTTLSYNELLTKISELFEDETAGNIIRIKGFIDEEGCWKEVNAIKNEIKTTDSKLGQQVIIVIGEKLNAEVISKYFPCEFSSIKTY